MLSNFCRDNFISESLAKRSLKIYYEYVTSLKLDFFDVKREHIHSFENKGFRDYLISKVSSDRAKNEILKTLSLYVDYATREKMFEDESFGYNNPFDIKFDKFKEKKRGRTFREAIPLEIMEELKWELVRNDYSLGKDFKKDYFNGEWIPSTTLALYFLLSVPIRGRQVQLLDSGLYDEYIYDFKSMVKNKKGIKKRSEGVIRLSEIGGESKEVLWISTNKSGKGGYEIPFVDKDLRSHLKYQIEWLKEMGEYGAVDKRALVNCVDKNYPKFYCLFRDISVGDSPVSKAKLFSLWQTLCQRVQDKAGFKLIEDGQVKYDLHSLRVSGISGLLNEKGMSLELVSKYLVNHSTLAQTQYYQKDNSELLESYILEKQNIKLIGG